MNADVETYIRQNCGWSKLPKNIKQVLGNSQKDYEKWIIQFSIKNQLRFRGNIVRLVKKDEKGYYEELLKYSRDHLMLYPYHLSDFIVAGMRITPFQYYISIMQDLLEQERSYDSLPNFTAADCLRLLGIGRNQYIDLMNHCRSSKKFFGVRKKPVRELLPSRPVDSVPIEPWWLVQVGYVTEDDIRLVSKTEKEIIDKIIDHGAQRAGEMVLKDVKTLYTKGLVFLAVPVEDNDCFIVPPLEGFVMNRVLGDYFENLLYQIFVSIDEHTTVAELANVLQTDLQLIKNVVSMYCRLGFARKKGVDSNDEKYHSSWKTTTPNQMQRTRSKEMEDFLSSLNTETEGVIIEGGTPFTTPFTTPVATPVATPSATEAPVSMSDLLTSISTHTKRIGFLFDSTLTAFLMMGNLSSGLKSHAVTMFEVGKLSDESLDSFLTELEKVGDVGEGEAQRYFHHALTLRNTILFLRHNSQMLIGHPESSEESVSIGPALDLIRCESLQNLDSDVCSRLLNKNYSLLVSMAPLTNEIRPVSSCKPPHLGPAIPEVNSVWFKLFVYTLTKLGPPSLLLAKGTRLRVLPRIFRSHERLLITPWGHDPGNVPAANALITLNDALCHSAVLIQGQGTGGEMAYVPFPLDESSDDDSGNMRNHPAIQTLSSFIDLHHTCGYITLMRLGNSIPNPVREPAKGATAHSTPIICSSPTSPINGIKDHISKELLASELDKLAQEDLLSSNNNNENFSCEKSGVKSSKCDENWVLLDCSFGIPLFDANLNQDVCQRVVKFKLCQSDNLKELMQSSRKMVIQLLDFMNNHQGGSENDRTSKRFVFPSRKGERDMPLPTRNLHYSDGQLAVWDGS